MTPALLRWRKMTSFVTRHCCTSYRAIHRSAVTRAASDPRIQDLGEEIRDKYAVIREHYDKPKYPIVLAHGLFGFDELRLAGPHLPGVQYWRGIREALEAKDIEVITSAVPPSGSIEARAEKLAEVIAQKAGGKSVNVVAHSMGGLDARYMISRLKPPGVHVKSLTTIASPHRGSAFVDYVLDQIGPENLPTAYGVLRFFNVETGAFAQLSRKYMQEEFNPNTPNVEGVKYFSYGATLEPVRWSTFRGLHDLVKDLENGAANDGLVSVPSSRWGEYKGTLVGVSHLDLINWTSRAKWMLYSLVGKKPDFNAIAFYLDICDMLAKEGL